MNPFMQESQRQNNVQIKKADITHAKEIQTIEQDVFPNPLSLSFLVQELSDNPFAAYFVAEHKDKIIGYIGYHVVDDHAEMMNVAVKKAYQHHGYGKKILEDTLDILKEMQVTHVTLEVRPSNRHAIHLYESLQFKKTSIRKGYYQNEDALLYMKEMK